MKAEGNGEARIALVTGAGAERSIGRAIALRLAEDGLDVAVNDIQKSEGLQDLAEEIRRKGRRSLVVGADVTDAGAVEGMVQAVADGLGRLDVMVANAGISQIKPLLEVTPEEWDRMMAINAKGVFLSYQAAARQMVRQGAGGKIIGAGSIVAHRSDPLVGHYSASKWAVRGLTQAAAQEWARYGITVNAYCPGIVNTTLWDMVDETLAELNNLESGEPTKLAVERIALGRMSEPEDVAGYVSYLASRDSDYMTGQSVMIDGGILFS